MASRVKKRRKLMRPVHSNVGLEARYRRMLMREIRPMCDETERRVHAAYKKDPPVMAMDATPARELNDSVKKMKRKWLDRFAKMAPRLARFFADDVLKRSDATLLKILRDGGISVRFAMTDSMRDVLAATVEQNVALIRSIPEKYFGEIEGIVMRSAQAGRDLSSMTKELEQKFGVSRRRAAFIARDQNNKATSAMVRARQLDLGLDDAVWYHSHAGREPRKTHLANDGKGFKLSEGWYDPDPKVQRHIMPGELPNCRCFWRPVIKGFT